jgi:hypothetical protein
VGGVTECSNNIVTCPGIRDNKLWVSVVPGSSSFLFFPRCSLSFTATTAPSLGALVSSNPIRSGQFLESFVLLFCCFFSLFFLLAMGGPVFLHYRLALYLPFVFRFGGVDPSTRSNVCFYVTCWTSCLLASRIPAPGSSWGSCRLVLLFKDVIAVLSSTLRCQLRLSSFSGIAASYRLLGATVDSSWAALLSGLLAQPLTWSSFFFWRCASFAMPLLHGWTPSSGIHDIPGSFPSAPVTNSELSWLTIMGSGFDDWIYWHFFTITINYNSSQSMTD